MRDVEEFVSNWAQNARACESLRESDVVELAQHLRDSMDSLTDQGMPADEAFLLAEHRLGKTHDLVSEFAKTNGGVVWTRRVYWMIAGHLLMLILSTSIGLVFSVAQLASVAAGWSATLATTASCGIAILCWIGVFSCFRATANGSPSTLRSAAFWWNRSSTPWWVLGFIGLLLFPQMARLGVTVVCSRLLSHASFGELQLQGACSAAVLWVALMAFSLLLLASLRHKMRLAA